MKVYGNPASTCTRKVLATLAEKGQAFEYVVVEMSKGEHKSPAFTALQPFGQVPVLDHDGFVLYESRAIIRYLDEVVPGVKLTPADAKGRGQMEQWISVEAANFTPAAMKIVYQTIFASWFGREPNQAAIEDGRKQLQLPLDVLDRRLADHPWLMGEQFTLADICYLPYFEYLEVGGDGELVHSRPNVSRWWSAARARPSWQKALGK